MPAGETVRFYVSSSVPYTMSVCRLGHDVNDRRADIVLHQFESARAGIQPIHPGSYILVEKGLEADFKLRGLTLECWVRPWTTKQRQVILGQCDYPGRCGYALLINERAQMEFYIGNGGAFLMENVYAAGQVEERVWHHVVACWDGERASIWINGKVSGQWPGPFDVRPGQAPLRLGCGGVSDSADRFLDGDLVMPVIYDRALHADEITRRFCEKGMRIPMDRSVLGCWPLREEQGEFVRDASGYQRTGRIINHGTWMIAGPAYEVQSISGGGREAELLHDASRGHGIRFASDDLYDCRWKVSHEYRVPESAKSGIYVGRVSYELEGRACFYDITFIVTRAESAAPKPMLVLCSTNTWRAYATSPFAKTQETDPTWPRRAAGLSNSHPHAPAFSTYSFHKMGQPSYYSGLRMPWPNANPYCFYDPPGIGFSHWVRLERYLHIWLDEVGYGYDVVADLDLHRNPDLLRDYRTVVINGHSEYWSIPAYEGLDTYLKGGGTAIVLSGNTMWWRVSFDDEFSVMEQRKTADLTVESPNRPPGGPNSEQWHSQDWARGGILRFAGRAAADVIGLDTAGWAFADGDDFGVYRVEMPDHFLFRHPHPVELAKGATFGHAPGGGLPRAIGHEWDLTVATLRKMTRVVPDGEKLPSPHEGIEVIATGTRRVPGKLDAYLDYFERPTESLAGLSAEMIYWRRPQGGRVFNAGAVCASWVLGVDSQFGRLLQNVLHHFGVTACGQEAKSLSSPASGN